MKKILSIFLILLFAATATSYAQFFRGQTDNNYSSNPSGNTRTGYNSRLNYSGIPESIPQTNNDANFNSSTNYFGESGEASTEDYGGGFFRSSTESDPGGRPGSGGGIGQEAPLGDGWPVVIACCVALILLRLFDKDRRGLNNYEEMNYLEDEDILSPKSSYRDWNKKSL